ncbi:MAG: hypothetical protein HN742_22485 [Lentisphaerae bacterium]|jgi:hypothetical protein|nr:hypothetical protein [Lentisphaerota bacterium]MBT4822046.1 hypothetical protein [Lentisphaerota bacterium]MBT5605003.1 hypothetical protein [Lentisphaerota bacterium]MBT7054633.1 hypothetical protein [Lentisphaerota bacterium]MBT7844662.1 hypothetical protein [Lentisphaerota bacterium]
MAKKPKVTEKLSFVEIVMRADADVIKAAYEARIKIDKLLVLRDEAYTRVFDLEDQIEDVVGEQGTFVFPPPPCPIAGMPSPIPATRRPPPSKKAAVPAPQETGTKTDGSTVDGDGPVPEKAPASAPETSKASPDKDNTPEPEPAVAPPPPDAADVPDEDSTRE